MKNKMIWPSIRNIKSTNLNVKKYVYTNDTAVAESVLYKYPTYEERTVICCSTQSGCPVGCRFCGAGDNFVRSLTKDEIIDQVTHLFRDNDIDPVKVSKMQIMFMSMGEPLLNLKALDPAIRELTKMYPQASLLISTSAPRINYFPLIKLSQDVPAVGLQFSVHESLDSARDLLIPFKKKLSLSEMTQYGALWAGATGRRPFFNYCVHSNNGSQADVDRLKSLFLSEIWECTLSVICERDEHIAAANERQRKLVSTFQTMMVEAGYSTRMFDPAGQDDIGGGCGQLWFVQEWMRMNPSLARPSIGNGMNKVHTPY